MVETERTDKQRQKAIRKGSWQAFAAAPPATCVSGPRAPLFSEALGDCQDETVTLGRLQRQYRPTPAVVRWVTDYIDSASKEGSREETTEFWLIRPAASVQTHVSPFL